MAVAAYHRIVEQGNDTEHFHDFASRMVLAAMVPLALGITGDFYVVTAKVTGSAEMAAALSFVMLLFFFGLWFGYSLYKREHRPDEGSQSRQGAKEGARA